MGIRAALPVYKLARGGPAAQKRLRAISRPGDHHGYDDANTFFDFFDHAFGKCDNSLSCGVHHAVQRKSLGIVMSIVSNEAVLSTTLAKLLCCCVSDVIT